MAVFVVYNLVKDEGPGVDLMNPLISSGNLKDQLNHRTVGFVSASDSTTGDRAIRIYGAEADNGLVDFSDWGSMKDPTELHRWNVICVWWRSSKHKSSLWVNYGKDFTCSKVMEFVGSENTTGSQTVVGNTFNNAYRLDAYIANIEVYDTVHMCDHFIEARMRFLCDRYNIGDGPYYCPPPDVDYL